MGQLIFSSEGITTYGFIVALFLIVILIDLVWLRKFEREAIMVLYGIIAIFFRYAVLGYLFPNVVDIANTTKRALFKAIALMVLYFCSRGAMMRFLGFLTQVEAKIDKSGK